MGWLWMMGAVPLAIGGKVRDEQGAVVAGAQVSLLSDPSIRQTTDADGGFILDTPVPLPRRQSLQLKARNLFGIGIQGHRLKLVLSSPSLAGSITFHSINGRVRVVMPVRSLKAGSHLLDLPGLAPGAYSLGLSLGRFTASAHLIRTAKAILLMRKPAGQGLSRDFGNDQGTGQAAPAEVDALLVRKAGYREACIPLLAYDQSGITLALSPNPDAIPTSSPLADIKLMGMIG